MAGPAAPTTAGPRPTRGGEAFTRHLQALGACYAAVFVLPPGRAGYFAITEPAGVPADLPALAAHLGTAPGWEVRPVELPCGPAVTCTEYARISGGRDRVDAVQEHAFAVHPRDGRLVAFTMGVQDDQRRPEHAHLFTEILYTVSFSR